MPQITYFDNSECLRLLQNQPGGLIHIMDDQARRAPKKTDHAMVEAFGKRWGNHSPFKVGSVDRSGVWVLCLELLGDECGGNVEADHGLSHRGTV